MPESGTFVRALWGHDDFPIRKMIEREVDEAARHPIPVQPTLWYAYGRNNEAFLISLGIKPILLSVEPLPTFGYTKPTQHDGHTVINGMSMWQLKYHSCAHALKTHHDCIWLDMDTIPEMAIPDYFWERMRQGREFQCSLQQNSRPRAGWRQHEPRKTPCGSLIYFRGLATVERLLEIYDERGYEWDLTTLARYVDELWGGWKDSSQYKAAGFEPPFHWTGRQIHQPEEKVFRSGWKRGLRAVVNGRTA